MQLLRLGPNWDPEKMTFSPRAMVPQGKKRKTLFCLLPFVVKYESKQFKDKSLSAQDVGSLGEFINRQDGQRTDGTLLFPALVTLQ